MLHRKRPIPAAMPECRQAGQRSDGARQAFPTKKTGPKNAHSPSIATIIASVIMMTYPVFLFSAFFNHDKVETRNYDAMGFYCGNS
jgi:hypothetical protein